VRFESAVFFIAAIRLPQHGACQSLGSAAAAAAGVYACPLPGLLAPAEVAELGLSTENRSYTLTFASQHHCCTYLPQDARFSGAQFPTLPSQAARTALGKFEVVLRADCLAVDLPLLQPYLVRPVSADGFEEAAR